MREYTFVQPLERWSKTARTWFDGSVESVDRRLADCRQLLAASRAAVGSNWGHDSVQLHCDRIASLQAAEAVLEGQRASLLTAGNDRVARGDHATLDVDFGENAPDHTNPYTGETGRRSQMETHGDGSGYHWKHPEAARDRRYVELEAAKFVANNPGVDRDELITQARHKAQVETSTYPVTRSRAVTAAFVQRVAQLHRPARRQRTAALTAPDVADETMFM